QPDEQGGEQRRRREADGGQRSRDADRHGAEDEPRRRHPHRANASVRPMLVSEAVGRTVEALGGDVVFGLMGSGNLAVTNAIVAAGGRFFSSRHETGALCMADGYARVSGRLGVASVHQGPGLTNALTGLTEAAKSR